MGFAVKHQMFRLYSILRSATFREPALCRSATCSVGVSSGLSQVAIRVLLVAALAMK
jgi:hypothetical protein